MARRIVTTYTGTMHTTLHAPLSLLLTQFVLAHVLVCTLLSAENSFTITDTIHIEKPLRSGINFYGAAPWKPWNSTVQRNVWSDWYSMEPIHYRHNFIASGGSVDTIACGKKAEVAISAKGKPVFSAGCGFYGLYPDGFWNGATVHIYRPLFDSYDLKEIRVDTVKEFYGSIVGEERVVLNGIGEPIQKGDLFVLSMDRLDFPIIYDNPKRQKNKTNGFFKPSARSAVTWKMDDSTFCPEDGSTASMRVQMTGAIDKRKGPTGMEHQFLRNGGKELDFDPGKSYRFQVWLRQEGLKSPVTVQLGDRFTEEVEVGPEWQKFEWDVPNHPIKKGNSEPLKIASTTAGTVWIDNMLVYRTDLEPFAIYPEWIDILKDMQPQLIRNPGARSLISLDNFLTKGFERKMLWDEGFTMAGDNKGAFSLPEMLSLCEEVGSTPYIQAYVLWSDEEIDRFMEYMAAPADVGYGKLRAQHGHPQPWTEVFDTIYVEVSNEMWNRNFSPQAFSNYPRMAGVVANRLFKRMKENQWNSKPDVFTGICSAFVHSLYYQKDRKTEEYLIEDAKKKWTLICAEHCPEMDCLATAPSGYFGGWDGDTPIGSEEQADVDLFQGHLYYSARMMEPKIEEINLLRDYLMTKFDRQRPIELNMYEYGPGYQLPSAQQPFIEEEERVQKALPLGIATLDNLLFMNAHNCTGNLFILGRGNKFNTHSMAMVPHSATLGVLLRNRYCRGSLMQVEKTEVTRVDLPKIEVMSRSNTGKKRRRSIQLTTVWNW